MTQVGAVLGTPYYMSPEQARALRDVDHRADLWALGVILFRAVTGNRPFDGTTAAALAMQICTDPPPLVGTFDPALPSALDAFFAQALAKDPAQRFGSAREMAQAFADVAGQSLPAARMRFGTWTGGDPAPMGDPGGSSTPPLVPTAAPGPGFTGPGVEPPPATGTTPAQNRRPMFITVAIVSVVGLFGAVVLISQFKSAAKEPVPSAVQTNPAPVLPPAAPPSATAAPVEPKAPEPPPEDLEVIETAAPVASVDPAKPILKTNKTAPTGSTKKRSRDLGY